MYWCGRHILSERGQEWQGSVVGAVKEANGTEHAYKMIGGWSIVQSSISFTRWANRVENDSVRIANDDFVAMGRGLPWRGGRL